MRWEADLKVGITVVVAGVLLAILLTMASNWVVGTPGRELTFHFKTVNNVKRGAAVHLAGVAIGKVIDIRLDEGGFGVIRARIDPPVQLREGLTPVLTTLGFIGETYISLKNGPPGNPPLDWSKPVTGQTPPDAMELIAQVQESMKTVSDFVETAQSVLEDSRDELQGTAASVRRLTDMMSKRIDLFTARTWPILDQMSRTLALLEERLPGMMDDTQKVLETTHQEIRTAGDDLRTLNASAQEWMTDTRRDTKTLVRETSATIEQMREFLASMSDEAKEMRADLGRAVETTSGAVADGQERLNRSLDRLDAGIERADELVSRLDRIAQQVEAGEGTIGQLLTDPSLAAQASETFSTATDALKDVGSLTSSLQSLAPESPPRVTLGVETTYRGAVRGLQSELGVRIRRGDDQSLFGAVSTRNTEELLSLVLAQRIGPVWARIGFIDSQASLGADWNVRSWLTLRAEALRITAPLLDAEDTFQWPRLDAEVHIRPFSTVRVILGAENLADDPGIVIGLRGGY